jgi:pimeloyl-ACP methyl ester carboxylesterase
VEKYRLPGVPVFIYGASYGTYLARRYLQLFPRQPQGVILEGIADSRDHMTGYDAALIRATNELLDRCARSPACGSHFDGPPAAAIRKTLNSLDQGHCAALGFTTADAKAVLTGMTFSATTRVLVPALARRIERCTPGDVAIVQGALGSYLAFVSGKGYSSVLHNHVALSEMYTPKESTRALQKQVDAAALSTGLELGYSKIASIWPKYPRNDLVGREPDYDGPLLMLHGRLDTPSPLPRALPVRDHFRGAHQYWVEFPEGAHGMTSKTPTPDGSDCGRSIYLQFVDHPEAAPDTGCISRIRPIDWNSTPDDAMRFMGTLDIWDGVPEASAAVTGSH